MTQPPEIRETGVLHEATGAVARREEGRIVVYVLATMTAEEKKTAIREALRALRRQERGRRGLALIPGAAGAVRLAVQHPGQAVTATVAAVTAGAAIYGAGPPLRLPSSPQAPPAVTRIAPHVKRSRRPDTGPVASPVPFRTAAQVPSSPRPSPHRSGPEPPRSSPSPSASPATARPSPSPASPSPVVTVTAAASPSPGLGNVVCVGLLGIRICV